MCVLVDIYIHIYIDRCTEEKERLYYIKKYPIK